MTQYIIEGRHFGEIPKTIHTQSILFVCPTCGETWAKILVEGAPFYPERRPCSLHEWIGFVPGSILTEFDARHQVPMLYHRTLEGMPPKVLAYELETIMQAYEKGVFDG